MRAMSARSAVAPQLGALLLLDAGPGLRPPGRRTAARRAGPCRSPAAPATGPAPAGGGRRPLARRPRLRRPPARAPAPVPGPGGRAGPPRPGRVRDGSGAAAGPAAVVGHASSRACPVAGWPCWSSCTTSSSTGSAAWRCSAVSSTRERPTRSARRARSRGLVPPTPASSPMPRGRRCGRCAGCRPPSAGSVGPRPSAAGCIRRGRRRPRCWAGPGRATGSRWCGPTCASCTPPPTAAAARSTTRSSPRSPAPWRRSWNDGGSRSRRCGSRSW